MGRIGKKLRMRRFKQSLEDIQRRKQDRISIFDDSERTDPSPKAAIESEFHFFNRSSRVEFQRVRDLISGLVRQYPNEEIYEIVARIRSGDDTAFRSSVFELVLHETLHRRGFRLTVHPELPNGRQTRPDFLVEAPNGESFYLEATLASEAGYVDRPSRARIEQFLDVLNKQPHKNFMLDVQNEGYPTSQPGSKQLLRGLHRWLDSLDPDMIAALIAERRFEEMPLMPWEHSGWEVIFRPIPLSAAKRGRSRRLIGMYDAGGGVVDHWNPLRKAIRKKGERYGELDKPLLIAVNLDSGFLDRIDERQALFGQEEFVFRVGDPNAELRFRRKQNGAWIGQNGPEYTRVSGAWIFNDIQASAIVGKRNTIYFNPWASHALTDSLKIFPHVLVQDNKFEELGGEAIATILELDDNWPE